MKKLKLYVDTSIISAAIDNREPEKKDYTLQLIDEIKKGKHEPFISVVVAVEIGESDPDTAVHLRKVTEDLNPEELILNKEAQILADKYIEQGVIPVEYEDDALHIAIATVNNLDVIISWNFKHIVKVKTKIEVKGINVLMGYKEIEISSPVEVVSNV